MMRVIAGALIALSGVIFYLASRKGGIQQRLTQLEEKAIPRQDNLFHWLGACFDKRIRGISFAMSLEKAMQQAQVPWTPGEFLLMCGFAGSTFGFMGGMLLRNWLVAFILAPLGFFLPFLWLSKRIRHRRHLLDQQLPDAIMLISNALRAGNSFLQALHMVELHMPEPSAGAFRVTIQEIKWGIPIETALLNMRSRIASADIELLTEAILIQRETGGNLSEILLNIHRTIRDRHQLQGEIKASTAQGKLSGLILALMPVVVGSLFFLINPGYILTLFVNPLGRLMLVVALVLECFGGLMIRKIVRLDF